MLVLAEDAATFFLLGRMAEELPAAARAIANAAALLKARRLGLRPVLWTT